MIPMRAMMRGHASSRRLRLNGRVLGTALSAAAVVSTATSAPVGASTQFPPLIEYVLTEWTKHNGLQSGPVRAIGQDQDGYLWLGTDSGLVRFDGTEFKLSPHNDALRERPLINALGTARDGSVWLGFADPGGIARIKGTELQTFTARDGLFEGYVRAFLEDDEGTVWAGGRGGLARYRDGRWQRIGEEHGLPSGRVYTFCRDNDGNMWLSSSAGLFRHRAHDDRFVAMSRDRTLVASLTVDGDGHIWAADNVSVMRVDDAPRDDRGDTELALEANIVMSDANGHLWISVSGEGLLRVNPRTKPATVAKALAASSALSVFEDRDGNIWAGTVHGLVRLRRTDVRTEQRLSSGVVLSIASTKSSIWVGTFDGLNEFAIRGGAAQPAGAWLHGHQVIALHADRTDRVWAVTDKVIGVSTHGQFQQLSLPRSVQPRRVRAFTVDWRNRLWICDSDVGLYVWDGRTKSSFDHDPRIAHKQCLAAQTDSAGRVWLGFAEGLARFTDDVLTYFGKNDGVATDYVTAIYEDSRHAVWIGARDGLSRIGGGAPIATPGEASDATPGEALVARQGEATATVRGPGGLLSGVTAIAEDHSGHIWLANSTGLLRVDPGTFARAAADRQHTIDHVVLDLSDGVNSTLGPFGYPRAATTRDGTLWFATSTGVTLLDPATVLRRGRAPRVEITNLVVDGRAVEGGFPPSLPAGTQRVQINFSALELSIPNKVRYRYMMRGFDAGWVHNVFAHQASYTNLPPGNYEFLVSATTGDIWDDSRATWAFTLTPRFYQTTWFVPALVLACAIAVVSVWRFHLSSVRRKLALISAERARLSREIHDTLLQTLVGVALELEVIDTQQRAAASSTDGGRVASTPPSSGIRLLRQRVQAQIREAREWVAKLRTPGSEFDDISHELRQFANRATEGTAVRFHLTSTGQADWCSRRTKEQLLRIAQEAITNAVRHGRPSTIRCELHFAADGVRLRVSDDGRGFNIDESHIGKVDHWGLVSMKERAELVGGRFTVASYAGGGTSIEVVAPRLSELVSANE